MKTQDNACFNNLLSISLSDIQARHPVRVHKITPETKLDYSHTVA